MCDSTSEAMYKSKLAGRFTEKWITDSQKSLLLFTANVIMVLLKTVFKKEILF